MNWPSREQIAPGAMVGGSVVVAAGIVWASTADPVNTLAVAILQALTVILGVGGSFIFGRLAARDAARELMKPHARSSFRRVRSLYDAFSRIAGTAQVLVANMEEQARATGSSTVALSEVKLSFHVVEAQVIEQIGTANDALEDWRDLVPEEIAALEVRAAEQRGTDG